MDAVPFVPLPLQYPIHHIRLADLEFPLPNELAYAIVSKRRKFVIDAYNEYCILSATNNCLDDFLDMFWADCIVDNELRARTIKAFVEKDKHGFQPWLTLSIRHSIDYIPCFHIEEATVLLVQHDRKRYFIFVSNRVVTELGYVHKTGTVHEVQFWITKPICISEKKGKIYAHVSDTQVTVIQCGMERTSS